VFVEGPLAFFRTGLVLLKLLKTDIQNVRDVSEFTQAFESKVKAVTDVEKFRARMRATYLNPSLLNAVRAKNIDEHQNRFDDSPKQRIRGFEKCLESSPYCHWKRNQTYKDYDDCVFRVYSLPERLKFNFFDPFKNSSDTKGYDFLRIKDDKGMVNEDRFSTFSSKKTTAKANKKPSIKTTLVEPFDGEDEATMHRTYLEKLITGNIPSQDRTANPGIAGIKSINDSQAPDNTGDFRTNMNSTELLNHNSPKNTVRKASDTSESQMLKKLGSQLIQPPKPYFENESGVEEREQVRITVARKKQIEKNLVVARCAHICEFMKYEREQQGIDAIARNNYFLIANSILYKYLGEGLKKFHKQTLKVISDRPKGVEVPQGIFRTNLAGRRNFPRVSLDKWPRNLQRFSSLEIGKQMVHSRHVVPAYLRGFNERQRRFTEINRKVDTRYPPVEAASNEEVQDIGLDEIQAKYKNAYSLNMEGLRQDIMRISKESRNVEKENSELAMQSL
jgi:hypothetical protein